MKISRTRFVTIFLISVFVFQFVSNSILGNEIGLFPKNGEWFPGAGSSIVWKDTLSAIIFPLKYIMISPLSFLAQEPDPAPPVLLLAFAIYWTAIAFVLHFLLTKIPGNRKS